MSCVYGFNAVTDEPVGSFRSKFLPVFISCIYLFSNLFLGFLVDIFGCLQSSRHYFLVDTARKLNLDKTFGRLPGRQFTSCLSVLVIHPEYWNIDLLTLEQSFSSPPFLWGRIVFFLEANGLENIQFSSGS